MSNIQMIFDEPTKKKGSKMQFIAVIYLTVTVLWLYVAQIRLEWDSKTKVLQASEIIPCACSALKPYFLLIELKVKAKSSKLDLWASSSWFMAE